MIDVDGKFTYSNIISIKKDGNNTDHQIFSNPAKNILNVKINGVNENATLEIFDEAGRKLKEEKIIMNGANSFSIDINNLQKGTYILLLKNKTINEQKKFVKE